MLSLPLDIADKTEFDHAVSEVLQEMAPDVVRIRHNIAQDWSDNWAVYFRVLISDEAGRTRLGEITRKVQKLLESKLKPLSMGLLSYYNFRGVSEQAAIREDSWE